MQEFEVSPEQAREWRKREQARLYDGTYTELPSNWRDMRWFWADDYSALRYPDHFTHISIDKVAMVAFTESEQKGVRDRQTRMSPGKYLTRFFSDVLSKAEVQALATQMGAQYNDDAELLFATTADEFETVYTEGPRSCMSHAPSDFASPVHPVRVYAGFDLHLAYLKREGRITARTLCWPEKLVFGRLYGDHIRLELALTKMGYKNGSLSGARITKLMHDDSYVIPYLDYLSGAIDKKDHLLLTDGSHSGYTCCTADRQNGLSEDQYSCSECGDSVDEDDCSTNDNGDRYCEGCWSNRYGYCEYHEESVPRDELEEVRVSRSNATGNYRVQHWGESARCDNAFYCQKDQVWYSCSRFEPTDVSGDTWGPEAVEQYAVMCEATDEYFRVRDTLTLEDGTVWSKAHFDRYGVNIDGKLYDQDDLPDGVEKPHKPSPTVVCEAQIELPLTGLHIKRIDSPEGDRWQVMDGDEPVVRGGYAYYVRENAEEELRHYVAELAVAQPTPQPIVVGCTVECIQGYSGTGFTLGNLYQVTRVFTEYGTPRISVLRDDNGIENGWMTEKFRFHSMPQTGLHIRHLPEQQWQYCVFDGDTVVDYWQTEEFANRDLARRIAVRQVGLHIRHEPHWNFKYKVFHGEMYLDGFLEEPQARRFYDELSGSRATLDNHIAARTRNPLRNVDLSTRQPEEVA